VLDGAGVPIAGANVIISQNSSITVASSILVTNADGVATAIVSVPASTPPGLYSMFASAAGAGAEVVINVS
jgi:hypothetical protein